MLQTRLWMGAILIGLAVGVLVVDDWLAPWYPFLLVVVLGLALAACYEMLVLLGPARRPSGWLCYAAVAAMVLVNWPAHVAAKTPIAEFIDADAWHWIVGTFAAAVLVTFLVEIAIFQEPGQSVARIALGTWIVAYLGLLPCFLTQLRWLDNRGTLALTLAIFVPKCGDSGAYFTGRLLGRHKMAPVLSPKKTWEGAVGHVVAAVLAAIGINRLGSLVTISGGVFAEIGFGATVGIAGMMGDLAESLIKRDCQQKDASRIMPGFGGVLDVVDSIIFAAPVAYWWLRI